MAFPVPVAMRATYLVLLLLCSCLFVATHAQQHHHVHSNHTSRLSLLAANPITSPVAVSAYSTKGYCSCAQPTPLPLLLNNTQTAAWDSAEAQAESDVSDSDADAELLGGRHAHHAKGSCHKLPTSSPGGGCGAAIGICPKGYCCSQAGFCSKVPSDCDGTCQCEYSGVGSRCKGSVPFALPKTLPTAAPGGLCGSYVATCPPRQCCSQFGFCVNDNSIYCSSPSCKLAASQLSLTCVAKTVYGNLLHSTSDADAAAEATAAAAAATASVDANPNYVAYERGRVRRFDWVATWKNLSLDGYTRPVIVINGDTFPTIKVDAGDRVIVKISNQLSEPLSIHWHGMLQERTNIMDGVVPVTQRPVAAGESYLYNFIADSPGSFWWHSHYSTQYVDGLWGALVVRDPTAQPFPADAVVAINDWYNENSNVLTQYYLSPASQGNEPVPNSALLNGNGQGYCDGPDQPPCKYSRVKGVASNCTNPRTKLRVVNSGAFSVFNFSIDGHKMIIVAEDAVEIQPLEVGSFQINNGQRYDILVCQDGAVSEDPVWIRARMIDSVFAYPANHSLVLGVLYFRDSDAGVLPTSLPTHLPPALRADVPPVPGEVVNPYALRTLGDVTPPGPPTMTLKYVIYFYNEPEWDPNATQYAHFSRVSLNMEPLAPNLIERYTNNPANIGPPTNVPVPPGGRGWHVVDVPLGSIVEVIINNNDTGEHPLHIHGHWWWVMDAGLPNAGNYNPSSNTRPQFGRLARDTVTVNLKSYIVLRYLAVNPGLWIMHCHIDWHLAGGLGIIFKEGFPPYNQSSIDKKPHKKHD